MYTLTSQGLFLAAGMVAATLEQMLYRIACGAIVLILWSLWLRAYTERIRRLASDETVACIERRARAKRAQSNVNS
jgi:hypothetical protein